jgi:glycyl-tRNA synthetase
MRAKLPFGIAQIGKAFRNEITPGNFTFRSREFEQMELEFFVTPSTDARWFSYWVKERLDWYVRFGIKQEHLRTLEYSKDELAHYSKATTDIEYAFPFARGGWAELEGVANRTDFDLRRHMEYAGQDLSYFDEETKERVVPYVIEPSAGVDRATLAFLIDAFEVVEGGRTTTTVAAKEAEIVLRLHRDLAPIKIAVLPLIKKAPLGPKAEEIAATLRRRWMVQYDESGTIGRRYRRQDEIGTPYCATVDFETIEGGTVTVRDRDTMAQERVAVRELEAYFGEKFSP